MNIPEENIFKENRSTLQKRYIKQHFPDLYEYLMEDESKFHERLYLLYHDRPVCECCKTNQTEFVNFRVGYKKHCSYQCANSDPNRIAKVKQTKLERYGDENYVNSAKTERTNIERYGVKSTAQHESVKQKSKQTKLERYGDENYNNREKIKQTNLEKYGVPWFVNKEKAKQTNLEKYGVPWFANREKAKQTKLERYGDENYLNHEKTKQTKLERYGDEYYNNFEKTKQTNLERYGVEYVMQNQTVKRKNKHNRNKFYIEQNDLIDITENQEWVCKCPHPGCDKCEHKSYIINSSQYYARIQQHIEPCTNILPITKAFSSHEILIRSILDNAGISYISNNRSILNGMELDIYIPSYNIAIECNGVYWHSSIEKPISYHIDKYKKCKDKGIQLISLWEDQIDNKYPIIESIIKAKLNIINHKIFARKCIIKEISASVCNEFLEHNHIQGKTRASIHLGLFYNSEMVSTMTFSKTTTGWELNRFCSLLNTIVVGGADKLLKYFIKTYNPTQIISYASNDISNGGLYKRLGFVEDNKITQAYWYIHKDRHIRYHRSSFSKSRLRSLGYDVEGKTESEVMQQLPYLKIYDSGHTKYTLNF